MNRLIIVGNGFDLSLGLKTSYNHFLIHYIRNSITNLVNQTRTRTNIIFDDKLNETFQVQDELIHIKLPTYFFRKDRRIDQLIEKLERFGLFRELSGYLMKEGFLLFKSRLLSEIYNNSRVNNWIDIELTYYDTLISVYKQHEGNPILEDKLEKYNHKFGILKSKLLEYLKEIKIDYENYDVNFYVDNYLKKMIGPYYSGSRIDKVMFLNFNYTRSLELLKKNYFGNNNFTINHIHGDITDPETVIFGFGDENEKSYVEFKNERSKELHKNIKRYHYYKDSKYDELKSFLDLDKFEVWIIGHSCGISDKTIFSEILENVNCESIRIFHYSMDNPKDEFHEKSIEIMKSFSLTSGKVPKLNFNKNDVIVQLQKRKS